MGRTAVAVLSGIIFMASGAFCQRANASPKFEVASLKQSPPANGRRLFPTSRNDPGRIERQRNSLKNLIIEAYEIQWDQVIGPDWLSKEYYDVVASMPPVMRTQVPLMLQALLSERLKLVVHREPREETVYAVEVARGGAKVRQADSSAGGYRNGEYELEFGSKAKIITGNISVAALIRLVSPGLDRHMIDDTGLKGFYDIRLEWTPPDFRPPGAVAPAPSNDLNVPVASTPVRTDLFEALEKQLGLKVVARKGPVEFIVVDQAERIPIEN